MKRVGIICLIFIACVTIITGQPNRADTLFTINAKPYSSDHFLKLYQNKKLQGKNLTSLSLKEALDLYINFQLKVLEAKALKLDTLLSFKKDLSNYRNHILTPFLNPVNISEEKIQEAFQRMQYFVGIRHILFKLKKDVNPKDTLQIYKKALDIREQLLKGESFSKLARIYSSDLLVNSNNGYLGYFTVFQMQYDLESVAYKLDINEISLPVRTQYGYHLIQVIDKIPNPGSIKVAHIMIALPRNYTLKQKEKAHKKIDSLYILLKQGADFDEIARKYSDDTKSANKGGELPWFSINRMIPEFEKAAFALDSNNAISKPIQTAYGWHLIKRLYLKDIGTYEQNREELINQIIRNGRCNIPKEIVISNLKTKYNLQENKQVLSNFYSILDYAYADLSKPLFYISNKKYRQEAFALYLQQQPSKKIDEEFKEYINRMYDSFVNNTILAFHKQHIEKHHPMVRSLLEEYRNAALVFNISNQMIWSPSVEDSVGLAAFFEKKRKHYQKTFGINISLQDIRETVIVDFQNYLEEKWLHELHEKYDVKIFTQTLQKIKQ